MIGQLFIGFLFCLHFAEAGLELGIFDLLFLPFDLHPLHFKDLLLGQLFPFQGQFLFFHLKTLALELHFSRSHGSLLLRLDLFLLLGLGSSPAGLLLPGPGCIVEHELAVLIHGGLQTSHVGPLVANLGHRLPHLRMKQVLQIDHLAVILAQGVDQVKSKQAVSFGAAVGYWFDPAGRDYLS